ncbi:MAG: hypothetical protein BZ138_02400 [Methanosphaera sp. rholeuAM270]|nr:MAG: hypothetical protein BZ138_02400 [Methanosphaera sp. rholeuAM270]
MRKSGSSLKLPDIDFDSLPNFKLDFFRRLTPNLSGISKNHLIIALVIILFLIMLLTVNSDRENVSVNDSDDEVVLPSSEVLGNNSLGYVVKEGPYGNSSSNIKIGYILGVHPREKGAHKLMEEAFKEKADNLSYCYYLYKVNVTENPTDFSLSRLNGQKLANEYIVPDAINDNFTFAVDCHYSNGAWNVQRFIFTPDEENKLSYEVAKDISDSFDWIIYFTPDNPSSPEYLTGPLNEGGVAAVIYEAYTEDDGNVTYSHDKQLIDYIDNWNF